MKITLKLFATLGQFLPERQAGNQIDLDVAEGTTPNDLIDRFGVPPEMVHLVLLNGIYLDAEQRASQSLTPGDALAIWPPVAGG